MNSNDKKRIIERYNKRLQDHGFSIDSLASGNEERRNERFKILTEIGIKSGDTILDLGCGFGDLQKYLLKNDIKVKYIGIDINEEIIKIAKKENSDLDVKVLDILNENFNESVDYIVSTSSFNNKLNDESNYEFVDKLLKKCYSIAKKGVAIDFLSSYVDYRVDDEVFYYEPEQLFSLAKKITKRVCLRHDYKLFEFCVYMYPDFKGWKE